jgi:hypothetical protein
MALDLLKHRVKKAIRQEGLRRTVWFRPSAVAAAVTAFLILGWRATSGPRWFPLRWFQTP